MNPGFSVSPLPGIPMIESGDDLAVIICNALGAADIHLIDGDIVCIAQKIISKAEGRTVSLADVTPSAEAIKLAEETEKDPRLVELILGESTDLLRKKPGVLIMRHRLGLVGAHAGVDQSNIEHGEVENALLLPTDPDASAARLKTELEARLATRLAVLITDSANRPWRLGTVGTAIGSAGITVLDDYRGGVDIYGRELKVTLINRADALAGAATLVMGETTEKIPVVIISGMPPETSTDTAQQINRPLEEDLFR
ncbi:MAG: coenzyme F420-0:L-glutamate ligase [Gammaproteobacteria bacterium]|nr:MAG: coenzyme F420-0:L-glutamate ligase [Gammaproteobacteria bacterium]